MAVALKVRRGPKVVKSKHRSIAAALLELQAALAPVGTVGATNLFRREYAPEQQVVARGELRAGRAFGGIDLRGDGSLEPWTGRLSKRPVPVGPDETAFAALARALEG